MKQSTKWRLIETCVLLAMVGAVLGYAFARAFLETAALWKWVFG